MKLIFKIATNGLPDRSGLLWGKEPNYTENSKYSSCRIVQISYLLCDDSYEIVEQKTYIIKATNFKIENSEFHGITDNISENNGILFSDMANDLKQYLNKVDTLISHSVNFNICVLKNELYRNNMNDIIDIINNKKLICTVERYTNLVGIPKKGGYKAPSLEELYEKVMKKSILKKYDIKEDVINLHKILLTLNN